MLTRRPPAHPWTSVLAAALIFLVAGCGSGTSAKSVDSPALKACKTQWADVAGTVIDMDTETNPSALASRWASTIAGISYQRQHAKASDCTQQIETQVNAIDSLRKFMERLRPYDMTYQLGQVRSAIDLYVHDPLPKPVKGENGHKVVPPTKKSAQAALNTLTRFAEAANQDLQPGWSQIVAVDLENAEQVRKAMKDLDFLASQSDPFQRCERALQVLVAAVTVQQSQ